MSIVNVATNGRKGAGYDAHNGKYVLPSAYEEGAAKKTYNACAERGRR